jgi:homoserine O-acetyltransferase/O-succinyltransferase
MAANRSTPSAADDAQRHPGYRAAQNGEFDLVSVGDLTLDAGGSIRNAAIGVVTLGTLNRHRDNAILVTTWYSGSHAPYVRNYIGAGRALDPSRYFIVIANQLGNGFSTSSIDPDRDSPLPALSISDDVIAQERLVRDGFGIDRLALVVGASMGAMQAYEWGARFPQSVERIAAVAGTAAPRPSADILIAAIAEALEPREQDDATAALRRHAQLWALFGYSRAFWNESGWRELGFESAEEFLENSFRPLMLSRSATVLSDLLGKWSRAGRHADGGAIALESIEARTRVIPISSDAIFTADDCRHDADRIPGARLETIETGLGHLAIQGAGPSYARAFDRIVGELLAH